jgi:ATP-binding cassette subfamily B protein
MLKLIRYLKPYTVFIIVAVALLFVQAMAELTLPDYMSNIVNVGIQQGGIEVAIPEAISKETFDNVSLFMNGEDRQEVLSHYDLITRDSATYEENLKKYPALESKDIYILKPEEIKDQQTLNLIFGKALIAYSGVKNGITGSNGSFTPPEGFNIPEGANVFLLMRLMPEAQRLEMLNQIDSMVEVMGENIVNQSGALVVKEIYEELGMDTDKLQSTYVLHTGLVMVLVTLLSALCTIMVAFIASKIAAASARRMRRDVFEKVENFSNSEFARFSTASLITRTTNDITQIQLVIVLMIRMVFYAPIIGVGGVIRALEKSTSMSWVIALAVIIMLGLVGIVFAIALPKFKKIQKLIDRLNLVTREHLSGLMVVRAFNTQEFEEERFDSVNKELTRTDLFVHRVMVVMMPAIMFVMNGTMLLIVWVGAHQIEASTMQVGDMMAYIQYAMLIIFAFLMLTMMFIMIPRASVSGARVSKILEVDPQIKDPKNPRKFDNDFKGTVEFKNVCYRFPGAEKNILNDISFTALPGQTTAIIGSTGSGKSTLLNMIPRFYDVCGGQVLVDGIDIREVNQHELRDKIGYVPQKGVLFSGTIESNLRYANENASDEEIESAAEIAQALEFITAKEEGYNSPISQGGTNVSGGQKQRLSIARALLKQPKILLFDDSFSALDFKTDAALRKRLKKETGDSTMIIVGQRIATIRNADQILVLDEGNLVGIGKHHELMKSCQIYREIAQSQLSAAELA